MPLFPLPIEGRTIRIWQPSMSRASCTAPMNHVHAAHPQVKFLPFERTSGDSAAKQHLLISPVLYLSIDSSVHITFWSSGSCLLVCRSSSLSLRQCCSHAIMQRLLLILQAQPRVVTIVPSHKIQALLVMSKAPKSFGCACLGFSERCLPLLNTSQVSTKQYHPMETLLFPVQVLYGRVLSLRPGTSEAWKGFVERHQHMCTTASFTC